MKPLCGKLRWQQLLPLSLIFSGWGGVVHAATDGGSLLNGVERQHQQLPTQPSTSHERQLLDEEAPDAKEQSESVFVRGFRFEGATLLTNSELHEKVATLANRKLSLPQIERAAHLVMEAYRESGLSARAFLAPQSILDGIVVISVIEGKLGTVSVDAVEPGVRFDVEDARKYVTAQLDAGDPIWINRLERALLLLNDLNGVRAIATLEAGKSLGETNVAVRLEREEPLLGSRVEVNNFGARSTGAAQALGVLNINNPFGRGDQINMYTLASEGSRYARLGYITPIGYEGWKLAANASHFQYKLIGDFATTNSKGRASAYDVALSYPVVRSRTNNVSLSLMGDRKYFLNRASDIVISEKRSQSFSAGLNGSRYDDLMGGGLLTYALGLSYGQIALSDAGAAAADALGPNTAGNYRKLTWSLTRQQALGHSLSLGVALSGQLASRNLDSSEKMYLGGPYTVRAYPVSEAGGDDGATLNVDLRYTLNSSVQLVGFADAGSVRQYHRSWAGRPGPNRINLAGAGLGFNVAVNGWSVRTTLAWRLGRNPLRNDSTGADSDGTRGSPRAWLQAGKTF